MRAFKNNFLKVCLGISVVFTVGFLFWIVGYIFVRGIGGINLQFFTDETEGVFPMIVSTFYLIICSLGIAVPVGVLSAIYLTEYTKQGKVVSIIRFATECLAGIPSIVYGLFGLLMFVTVMQWSWSIIAGGCTLAIMVLPTVIRTTEEAIKSVPQEYREASFGLGASKFRTVFGIVLPNALPGILAAVMLSVGRVVGETAAVMLTAGTVLGMPENFMSSGRSLAVHLYMLAKEGASLDMAFTTACVLIITVAAIVIISESLFKLVGRKAH